MPSLRVQVEDTSTGNRESHLFSRSPVRIGRNEMNDLTVPSGYVSQWHAVIQFSGNRIQYLDLGSTNGSVLNGERLGGGAPAEIQRSDVVAIGPIQFGLQLTDAVPVEEQRRGPTDGTAVDADAAQHLRVAQSAVDKLQSGYEAYRASWKECMRRIGIVMERVEPASRPMAVGLLESRCPEIKNEREYAQLKKALDLGGNISSPAQVADALSLPADTDGLLQSIVEALQVFASSFVELRKGFDQFSSELAVRTFQAETPLHRAEKGEEIIAYLMGNRGSEVADPARELKMAFADMMIHQVALISGVMEGVRGLLQRIGPAAIAEELAQEPETVGGIPIKKGVWPWSVTARWKRFEKKHREFTEEDQELSSVLFGRDFARSYGAATSDPKQGAKGAAPKGKPAKGKAPKAMAAERTQQLPKEEPAPRRPSRVRSPSRRGRGTSQDDR